MAQLELATALEEAKSTSSASFVWSGKNLTHFPDEIPNLTSLTLLDLSNNQLRNIPNLSSLTALRTLKLGDNAFTSIGSWLGELQSLTELDISVNSLTHLPDELPEHLLSLNASNNRLSALPESIARLSELKVLKLNNNELPKLPAGVATLGALEELCVQDNRLTSLPSDISALSSLKHLHVNKNRLLKIPMDLYKLPHLEILQVEQADLAEPPLVIVKGGKEAILSYMKAVAENNGSLSSLSSPMQADSAKSS
jgi:internalin A